MDMDENMKITYEFEVRSEKPVHHRVANDDRTRLHS